LRDLVGIAAIQSLIVRAKNAVAGIAVVARLGAWWTSPSMASSASAARAPAPSRRSSVSARGEPC